MKTLNELNFIEELNVWVLRKIDPLSKKYEKWEITELDLIALSFNSYLKLDSKFENDKDAENFVDNLTIEELSELWNKIKKIQENSNKKK